jgi:hypothetical protein
MHKCINYLQNCVINNVNANKLQLLTGIKCIFMPCQCQQTAVTNCERTLSVSCKIILIYIYIYIYNDTLPAKVQKISDDRIPPPDNCKQKTKATSSSFE